jgi:co-chaperonin GroES (HSP10)
MNKKCIPLRNNILCEVVVEATKSGIILADNNESMASKTLRAVSVGPTVEEVQIGDTVLVNPLDVMQQKVIVTKDLWIIPESAVMAVSR